MPGRPSWMRAVAALCLFLFITSSSAAVSVAVDGLAATSTPTAAASVANSAMSSPTIGAPRCHSAVLVLTLDPGDLGTGMDHVICHMFKELALGLVWALRELGVAATEACCPVMATTCWSVASEAPTIYDPAGDQVTF